MMDVFKALAQEPYESRGIIHSEIARIIYEVRRLGIRRLIESGRARAQSTYLLAKYLPDVLIESVELRETPDSAYGVDRVRDMPNVSLWWGDGRELLPKLARIEAPTAVLCDGPKSIAAVEVIDECFEHANVLVGFIHDMRRLDHGEPSQMRRVAMDRLPLHEFTDDPALVAAFSWMDARVAQAGGPVGQQHEAVYGSYGPTLGVFMNHKQTATSKEYPHVLFSQAG